VQLAGELEIGRATVLWGDDRGVMLADPITEQLDERFVQPDEHAAVVDDPAGHVDALEAVPELLCDVRVPTPGGPTMPARPDVK
jgi:hypothetical protein